jgi:GTPase Era involved in 16S rRNA processing
VDFNFFKRKQPLGARQSQRAALAARLIEAEAAVAEAQLAATEIALEGGNDTALDKAEANIRSRQARVITLNEAIAALDEEIAAQAAKEEDEADAKQRAATARQVHKLAAEIEDSLPDIVTSLKRGHTAIEAGRFVFGEIGLYKLLDELESSLPSSFAILASEMRGRAEETVARRAPAGLPVPSLSYLRRRQFRGKWFSR